MAVELIPSVLAATPSVFRQRLQLAEQLSSHVHLDLMDGIFVPTTSIRPAQLATFRFRRPPDIHAMVAKPLRWLSVWQGLQPRRVFLHVELGEELSPCIAFLKSNHIDVGLAIRPSTSLRRIARWVPSISTVLVLSVVPGWYGATFRPGTFRRLREVHRRYPKVRLAVDGHVDAGNLMPLVKAGAQSMVVGSDVMLNARPKAEWRRLQALRKRA